MDLGSSVTAFCGGWSQLSYARRYCHALGSLDAKDAAADTSAANNATVAFDHGERIRRPFGRTCVPFAVLKPPQVDPAPFEA